MAGPRQPASREWFLCFKRLNSMPQRFKLFSQRLKYILSGSLQKMKNISLRVFRNFTIIKLLAALLKNGLGLKEAEKGKKPA